jgi:peptide/nickel transport system substrate-binding protein
MRMTWKGFAKSLSVAALLALSLGAARAETTLKAVMHSDVKIVDPIWTTAYITRNHGYMIYDTLFAMDASGDIKPQMVDKYDVSADKLTYTFTLRDGLLWHDGKPVTAEDCVASIKRWAAKDSLGQKVMGFVDTITAGDARTFTVKLKEQTGLLLFALGKPSSNVPFMMPKRVADTDPNTQISDFTGSGPFVFKTDEWKPGDKAVYVKFGKYKPRSEPASGLAGGKVVKVDRVEWLAISDQQQAVNALLAGEIDYIEAPKHDLLPLLKAIRSAISTPSARTICTPRSTIQKSGRRSGMRSIRKIFCRQSSAIPPITKAARRCSSAGARMPPSAAWTACLSQTFRRRATY